MARRQLDLYALDQLETELDRLLTNGCVTVGQWDLAQICQHLSRSVNSTLEHVPLQVPLMMRMLLGPLMKRVVFKHRRFKDALKVPAGLEPGPAGDDPQKAADELKQIMRRLADFPGPWPDHAVFGRLSPEQWLDFHLIHASHHLSFIEAE